MLDLRLQISRLRIEYLNQMNTQSTLLAGCGVAMLNSGELTNLDDKAEWDDYSILSYAWIKFFNYLYSASAAVCLAASCWTIYTAMNLITLSIHSTLNGDSVVAITEADQLIETRMAEVRLVFVIALVSLLTASFTTTLTINTLKGDINGPDDLPGRKVSTVKGSTAEAWLNAKGAKVVAETTAVEAIAALRQGDAQAVVFDAPVLQYEAAKLEDEKLQMVGSLFEEQNYAFALQQDSELLERLNQGLLTLTERGVGTELKKKYFGE
jgi:ABC-type amino acid transport substrate-binding protein